MDDHHKFAPGWFNMAQYDADYIVPAAVVFLLTHEKNIIISYSANSKNHTTNIKASLYFYMPSGIAIYYIIICISVAFKRVVFYFHF